MTDRLWLFRLGHTWVCFSGSALFSGSPQHSTQSTGRERLSHKNLSKYFTVFCYIFISKPIPLSGGWNGIGLGHTRPSSESPSKYNRKIWGGGALSFPRARSLSKATFTVDILLLFQVVFRSKYIVVREHRSRKERAWVWVLSLPFTPVWMWTSYLTNPLSSSVKWNR